jgi:hypothetical protein
VQSSVNVTLNFPGLVTAFRPYAECSEHEMWINTRTLRSTLVVEMNMLHLEI